MAFFKRKRYYADPSNESSNRSVNVEEVYVAKATIILSYFDNLDYSPMCVSWYFLIEIKNDEYYELFSGKKLEKEENTHKDDMISKNFDTPYIEEVKPLKNYLVDQSLTQLDITFLFDFITQINISNSLKTLKR